jgi:hypothetical protein
MTRGTRIVGLMVWVLWVVGWALFLSGCLQGGTPELEGAWARTDARGCRVVVTFGPGDAYASDLSCGHRYSGTYAADGDVVHVVDQTGAYDMRWGWMPVDRLHLEWPGGELLLNRLP